MPDIQDLDALCALLLDPTKLSPVLDHVVRFEPWALAASATAPPRDAQAPAEPAEPAEPLAAPDPVP
jgi:hypothetical protein